MTEPPTAFLATLGGAKDHAARVGFARNLLASGGVDAVVGDAADGPGTPLKLAVICGSDADYADQAADTARSLKAAGVRTVYLAGKPGDLEPALTAAGVDGFIFAGADIVATLDAMLGALSNGAAA